MNNKRYLVDKAALMAGLESQRELLKEATRMAQISSELTRNMHDASLLGSLSVTDAYRDSLALSAVKSSIEEYKKNNLIIDIVEKMRSESELAFKMSASVCAERELALKLSASMRAESEFIDMMHSPVHTASAMGLLASESVMKQFAAIDDFTRVNSGVLGSISSVGDFTRILGSTCLSVVDRSNASGIVGLSALGTSLAFNPPYGKQFSDVLRSEIGDWRGDVDFASICSQNLRIQNEAYKDIGFNLSLTNFPVAGYFSTLSAAEIVSYDYTGSHPHDITRLLKTNQQRNNKVHAVISSEEAASTFIKIEKQLRRFVVKKMEKVYGKNWYLNKIPKDMLSRWNRERKNASGHDLFESYHMIDYSKFSDLHVIITDCENWDNVFCFSLDNKDDVTESFKRIRPARNALFHSRDLSNNELLMFYIEAKRILTITS